MFFRQRGKLVVNSDDMTTDQKHCVSEDLTRRRSHLLYLARVERKAGRFKHCWSHDGRILVRLHDDRVRGVTTTGELDKLVNETPVGHH